MATVEKIINSNLNFVDSSQNGMSDFINQVADAASVTFDNIIPDINYSVGGPEAAIETINNVAGSFPDPPDLLIPDYQPPELPDISISDIEHDLSVLEAARTELLSDLENGGYGINTDDETQLLDRTRDRAQQDAQAAVDEADRAHTSRRFGIPPGTLYTPLERISQDKRGALSETNRDIYIRRSEQFFNARQFAISTAATLDKARADILEVKFRIEEARARFTLASFSSQLDAFRVKLSASIDKARLSVSLYESQSNVVSDRVRAAAESARVTIANYEAGIRSVLGTFDYNLNRSRAELDAVKAQEDLRLKAAQTGADFYSNIVSGAMSAVNTVVSQSTEESSSS